MTAFYMERAPDTIVTRRVRTPVLCVLAVAAAVGMTWPLAAGIDHLGRTQNSGDARFAVWNVAWVAHALTTSPRTVYNANIFHPHRRTLAYSEANLGAGVIAIPAWLLTKNPFTTHNSVVLFAFTTSAIFAFLLARRLTGDAPAAATAAVLFAFCPYVFSHTAHIQLLMTAGVPLTMLMMHRLVDRPSAARGVALGLALTAQALSCAYYGIFAGLVVGYATLFYAASRRLWRNRRYWLAIVLAAILSSVIVLPFFLPYLQIQQETGFGRALDEARTYAATWRSYLASGGYAHRWMLLYIRDWNSEVLFPGYLGVGLGVTGFIVAVRRRSGRSDETGPVRPRETALFYGSAGAIVFWASLGPQAGLYTLLYYAIPVFSFLRAPGRMGILVMLSLAILAAFAVRTLRQRFPGPRAAAIAAIAAAAVLLDLRQAPFDWRAAEPIPAPYQVLANLPRGGLVEFPFYSRPIDYHIHTRYMLNSTMHWQPLVNGYSDHIPLDFGDMAHHLASFPSRESFLELRQRRVRYIMVHRNRYARPAAADVEKRLQEYLPHLTPIAGNDRLRLYEIVSWPHER